jgi:hypothetical protein
MVPEFEADTFRNLELCQSDEVREGSLITQKEILYTGESLPDYSDYAFALAGVISDDVAARIKDLTDEREVHEKAEILDNLDENRTTPSGQRFIDEVNTKIDRENARVATTDFMLAHAFIRADQPVLARAYMQRVTDPQYKLALFEAAVVCDNEASLEVLAAYDMGAQLEYELQQLPDQGWGAGSSRLLGELLCTKIVGFLEIHTSVDKIQRLIESKAKLSEDQMSRATLSLLRMYEDNLAMKLAELAGGEVPQLARLYMYKRDNEASAPEVKTVAGEIARDTNDSRRRNVLKHTAHYIINSELVTDENSDQRLVRAREHYITDKLGSVLKKFDKFLTNGDHDRFLNINYIGLVKGRVDKFTLNRPELASQFETILMRYMSNPASLSHVGIPELFAAATELVASRTPLKSKNGSEVAKMTGQLGVLQAEQPPIREHYATLSYYERYNQSAKVNEAVKSALDAITAMTSPLEQREALIVVSEFIGQAPQDLAEFDEKVARLTASNDKQLAHPLMQSILGIYHEQGSEETQPKAIKSAGVAPRRRPDNWKLFGYRMQQLRYGKKYQ